MKFLARTAAACVSAAALAFATVTPATAFAFPDGVSSAGSDAGTAITMLKAAQEFFTPKNTPDDIIPDEAPPIAQFFWPTAAARCIDGEHNAVATAIAVPGPAGLPLPGVPAREASFVFTILGTGPVAPVQQEPLFVHWVNTRTGQIGRSPLVFGGINPDGPSTVNTLVPTGEGIVVAAITGAVTTDTPTGPATCRFFPTVGTVTIPG